MKLCFEDNLFYNTQLWEESQAENARLRVEMAGIRSPLLLIISPELIDLLDEGKAYS